MMNADKQVMYSGVPQEDWENKSKYSRILSNGPKSPKASEKTRKNSGLIAFLILTGVTILLSTGVVIGLHYLKYSEKDGFIFGSLGTSNSSGEDTSTQKDILKPKPIISVNQNTVEPKTEDVHNQNGENQNPGVSPTGEITQKGSDTNGNQMKPIDNKGLSQVSEEVKENQENISNTDENSRKEVENANENENDHPESEKVDDKSKHIPEDTVGYEVQNGAKLLTNSTEDTTEDNWFDFILTKTILKPQEEKELEKEDITTQQNEKENKEATLLDNKNQTQNASKEKKEENEKEESEKEEKDKEGKEEKDEKDEKEHKQESQEEKISKDEEEKQEEKDEEEDSSLLYKAINNFAQKYFNSTNLNPSQVKDLFKSMSVGPSLEVIIIASGIIFIGLSLLIIAITCLVTRTRKVKIRREKIKKAVSDLEGAEKVILLTDEPSEDEYVKA